MVCKVRMKILYSILLAIVLFVATPPCVALADQADPDDIPSMQAYIYRNIETGDQLYIFYGNIPYATLPDALVTEAFMWRLLDTDNVTVIGSTVGTVYRTSGYGYNIYSMYFDSASAPTWDQPYLVRLSGNPIVFDTPPIYDFELSSADFSTITDTVLVKADLANKIIELANNLDVRWGLTGTDYSLINEQETGTVLSFYGETFFRNAIYGLQAMAPAAFQVVLTTITAEDRTWVTEYAENISNQYAGTFIETAQTGGAAMFNTSYDLVSIILLFALLIALVIGNVKITQNIYSGLIDAALVACIFGRIGIPAVLLPFLGLLGSISWVYISGKFWGVFR